MLSPQNKIIMKATPLIIAVFSLLVLSLLCCFPAPAHCRTNQAEMLGNLLKAKRTNQIDSSPFKPVRYEEIASRLHVADFSTDSNGEQASTTKEGDLIVRLPGQPPVSFRQYGGYVNVDPVKGKNMYYYFAEAQHPNKEELPLVLWLNGGPGCSSLGWGAFTEQGPFRVASDGKTLYTNKYAWNTVANILFVESPAGVGFSYSNTTSDYTTGDINTAGDNFVFLKNWLQKFPEYKGRDFYISGEGYAGHYVPQLAQNIVINRLETLDDSINLKGFTIGNGCINDETDNLGKYDFYGNHGLVSPEALAAMHKYCNFSSAATNDPTPECRAASDELNESAGYIFPYNIYGEECANFTRITDAPLPFSITEFDECSIIYVNHYLNREDVQKAMHANTTNIPRAWDQCTDVLKYDHSTLSVLDEIQNMLDNNVTVMIYSGDVDGNLPFTSSQYSIKAMNLTVETKFHAWYVAGQVGGFTETYKGGLTFATVRGAGQQLSSYQPLRGHSLLMHFIDGTPLPNTKRW